MSTTATTPSAAAATPAAAATTAEAAAAAITRERFLELNGRPIDEQAQHFVRALYHRFEGGVGAVLRLSDEFKSFLPGDADGASSELDELRAHMFLERKGQTKTATELRAYLKEVDIDNNSHVSFLEHALWEYGVELEQLFKPSGLNDPAIEECTRQIQRYYDGRAEFESEEHRLAREAAAAAAGGSVVAHHKAALDLQALRKRVTVRNRAAVQAAAGERTARKAAERKINAELDADAARVKQQETLRRGRAKANILARSQAFRVDDAEAVLG